MPTPPELSEISKHVAVCIEAINTEASRGRLRQHLIWELREILNHVGPADMTDSELAAAIAVFHPAHARVLAPPLASGTRPHLRVLSGGDAPASQSVS